MARGINAAGVPPCSSVQCSAMQCRQHSQSVSQSIRLASCSRFVSFRCVHCASPLAGLYYYIFSLFKISYPVQDVPCLTLPYLYNTYPTTYLPCDQSDCPIHCAVLPFAAFSYTYTLDSSCSIFCIM
jgi:hypothetical protein